MQNFYIDYTVNHVALSDAWNPFDHATRGVVVGATTVTFDDGVAANDSAKWHKIHPMTLGITALKGGSETIGQTEFYIGRNFISHNVQTGNKISFSFSGIRFTNPNT